jgi:ubiquinone biosynthesis protein COQ4
MLKLVRMFRFGTTFVRLVRDPNRVDLVFKLADGLDRDPAAVASILAHPNVGPVLARRARPPRVDLAALRALPEGSLGRAFAAFLDARGFDPAGLYHSGDVDPNASDFTLFKAHMERTHDIWHTVTGFDTDIAGELGLQAFGLAQAGTGLSYIILAAGMLGTLFFDRDDGERRMDAVVRGWQLGKRARPLFGADWEAMFAWPLDQVRAHFDLDVAARPAASLAA